MRVETITHYITEDGKRFSNEAEALDWEENLSTDINKHVFALDVLGDRTYDLDDAAFIYVDNDIMLDTIRKETCIDGMSHKGAWFWDVDKESWVLAPTTLNYLREKLTKYNQLYNIFQEMTE